MKSQNLHKRLLKGTAIVMFVSVLSKLSSFITDAILAGFLGATSKSDAYYMVSSIQQMIYPMISVGIWKVFLPVYKERITLGLNDKADKLANKIITLLSGISVAIVIVLMIFNTFIVSLVAPGFDADTTALCAKLVRISAPMYLFIVAAAVYASMLQCHNKFFGSQIREVASHIPTIIAAVFFYRSFGIEALAYALIAGGIARFLIELPFVDWKYRYKPDFRFKDEDIGTILKRLPSALISECVSHLNNLIDKIMASSLAAGTISALSYGAKLTHVFSGLLSSAVSTALYPQIIELVSFNKKDQLNRLILKIMNIFAVIMLPITLAAILFRKELVTVVYARGSFTQDAVILTSTIFAIYMLHLFSTACNTVLNNVFYANGDTKRPLIVSIGNLIQNIIFNFLLIGKYGAAGLAFATSISTFLNLVIRLIMVRRYITLDYKNFGWTVARVLIASGVSCFVPWFICRAVSLNVYLELVIAAAIGIVLYIGFVKLLRIRELKEIVRLTKSVLQKEES